MKNKRPEIAGLDACDLQILELLQQNARISNVEISEKVHLSAPQCYRRIKALESEGVIHGYAALIDREKLGLDILAFVTIAIDRAQYRRLREIETALSKFPEILECHAVSGTDGYQLKVIAADLKSYSRFLAEKLMRVPGVTSVRSAFSLREVKYSTHLPIT